LELGTATVSELAEKSGVKRTSIYNFLEELINIGFVSEIKQNDQILLIATEPEVLEKKAQQQLFDIKNIMPELQAMFNLPGNKPKVKFYPGIAGIKKAYDETLKSQGPLYAFSDHEKMMSIMPEWMWEYAERRTGAGIELKSISQEGEWAKKIEKTNATHKRQIKFVKNINFETEINIYDNIVAIVSFRKPYCGVVIEDAAIAQTLKSVWQLLWQSLP
jgi:sugar-specific transcriptional regulator TrmB